MDALEELYQLHTISATLLLCETDQDVQDITRAMESADHCVDAVESDQHQIREDRIFPSLLRFANHETKVLVVTYDQWVTYKEQMEPYVGHHNLLVFYGMEPQIQYIVIDWVKSLQRRGLLDAGKYHTFSLEKDPLIE